MKSKPRFTVVVADRRTGVYRRVGVRPLPFVLGVGALFVLPVLVGLGLRWSATSEIADLRATSDRLDVENRSFRVATGTLTNEIQALQSAIGELGDKAVVDGATAKAMEHLPAIVKSRAAGGPRSSEGLFTPAVRTPEDTFGVLRDLLYSLESRLQVVQGDVARRQALAGATPSIWPTRGWLTDSFGNRKDPFTGEREFHTGLDISADKGEPVYATANGTVDTAAASGSYGNMVVVSHGFGISTRYAHLDSFHVHSGDLGAPRRRRRLRRRHRARHWRSPALRGARLRPSAQPAPVPPEQRPALTERCSAGLRPAITRHQTNRGQA